MKDNRPTQRPQIHLPFLFSNHAMVWLPTRRPMYPVARLAALSSSHFLRGNPDKKASSQGNTTNWLWSEFIEVALDRAKVFSDGFWLRMEFLFY